MGRHRKSHSDGDDPAGLTSRSPDSDPEGQETQAEHSLNDLFGRRLVFAAISAIQVISSAVVSPVLAHLLSPTQFGALATGITLLPLFAALALCGLDQAALVEGAETSPAEARRLLALGVGISSLATVLLALLIPFWSGAAGFPQGSNRLLLEIVLCTAPAAIAQVSLTLLSSEDRLGPYGIVSVLSTGLASPIGLLLVVLVDRRATTFALALVVCQFLAALLGLAFSRPAWNGVIDFALARRAIRLGLPLTLGALSIFILNSGDRVIVQHQLGSQAVARYQIAYVIGSMSGLAVFYLVQAWAPRLLAIRDVEDRWAALGDARDRLLSVMAPSVAGLSLAAPLVLRIVAPASYDPRSLRTVVWLVAAAGFPLAMTGISSRALLSLRQARPIGYITFAAAAVNIALNFALVPSFGIAGSAAATLLSFSLQAALQFVALARTRRLPMVSPRLITALAGSLAVAAVGPFGPWNIQWSAAEFLAAVACLAWLLLALRSSREALSQRGNNADPVTVDPEPVAPQDLDVLTMPLPRPARHRAPDVLPFTETSDSFDPPQPLTEPLTSQPKPPTPEATGLDPLRDEWMPEGWPTHGWSADAQVADSWTTSSWIDGATGESWRPEGRTTHGWSADGWPADL